MTFLDSVNVVLDIFWKNSWSNCLLIAIFFLMSIFSIIKSKKINIYSCVLISFIILNLFSIYFHSIYHFLPQNPQWNFYYQTSRYIAFSGLGFTSFFIELILFYRLKILQKNNILQIKPLFLQLIKYSIFIELIVFQFFNLYTYKNWTPNFLYAIIDYSFSLSLVAIICFYFLNNKNIIFNKSFEKYMLIFSSSVILISVLIQQNPIIQKLFPDKIDSVVNYNDIFHICIIFPFIFLYFVQKKIRLI